MDFHIWISASSMLDSRLYIIYIANYILLLGRPLLFQKHFCLFFQKWIFSTCSASTIFGNMESALLGVQIIADNFLHASQNQSYL